MKNYPTNYNGNSDLLDEMFGGFFKPMFYEDKVGSMATDIKETENGYEMDVEMPGFKKEDISVDFEKGYLTVSAKSENKPEEKEGKHRYVKQERRFACRRSYYIGEVDESKITAKYSDGVLQQLRAGRFALGFTGAKEEAQDVVFSPFFTDRMVLITPNTPRYQRLLKEKMPVPALLAQEPLLLRETGSGSQKCADAFLEDVGLSSSALHIAARLNDQQSIRNLVAAGLGISIISGKAAQDDCERGRLLSVPLPGKSAGRSLYLVWRKAGALHPQTLAFIEFVRNFYENT